MSLKIYKNTKVIGQATVEGLSFPADALLHLTKKAFHEVQEAVNNDGSMTTGPARILVTVEQEAIVDDD